MHLVLLVTYRTGTRITDQQRFCQDCGIAVQDARTREVAEGILPRPTITPQGMRYQHSRRDTEDHAWIEVEHVHEIYCHGDERRCSHARAWAI